MDRGPAACLSLGSLRVDPAVVDQVLDAIQPAGMQAALDTLDTVRHDDATKRHAVELALEKARYEARRAQRQFDAVDPENRLVAGELEHRWNQALAEVADLDARVSAPRETAGPLSEAQRERVLALGTDLRGLWQHPAAPVDLKKRILRTVLEEIVVNNTDDSPQLWVWPCRARRAAGSARSGGVEPSKRCHTRLSAALPADAHADARCVESLATPMRLRRASVVRADCRPS